MLNPVSSSSRLFFQHQLSAWDETQNKRKHIWQSEKDAYRVWIREIMLQQTRVEQAKGYYDNFISKFPTIKHLNAALQAEVFKAWEGLGYYNRCRNILHTAKAICEEYKGEFPNTHEKIIKLKGIGIYTATAILSFCYNQDYAVCDGNVERILSRYIGLETNINSTTAKRNLQQLANQFLIKGKAGIYNQAIMDFGALICKPKNPLCTICPLSKKCVARKTKKENQIPLKIKTTKIKSVYLLFFHIRCKRKIALQLQSKNILWKQLRLLPFLALADSKTFKNDAEINQLASNYLGVKIKKEQLDIYHQVLTHRRVFAKFIDVTINNLSDIKQKEIEWILQSKVSQHSLPIIIRNYLKEPIK